MDPRGTLQFTHVSYQPILLPIKGVIDLEIVLDEVVGSEGEVVVVGYGKQTKISLVGAQSTVVATELQQPVANLSTALAGRIAGVIGVQRSGEPGMDGADIWIRGIATFSGSNDATPLVLIDGVSRDINAIDPQDIESFSILKDASATAVYGVRGANGVILIKTKTGKPGKTQFEVDYNEGMTKFTKVPQLTDGITYMNLTNEAMVASGLAGKYSQAYIDSTKAGKSPYVYPNVNWMNALFNPWGENRRANVSARGGSTNANYYVALSYYDEKGLLKTDGLSGYNSSERFKRYNFTSNLNLALTATTKVELGIQGYIINTTYPGNTASTVFDDAMQATPVLYPTMYPGDTIPGVSAQDAQMNPYGQLTQTGYQTNFSNQIYSNIRLSQDLAFLLKGLTFTTMFSFDAQNSQTISHLKQPDTYEVDPNNPYNPDGSLNLYQQYAGQNTLGFTNSNGGSHTIYTETGLNYDKNIGDHHISGMLLYSQSDNVQAFPTDLSSSLPYRFRGIAGRGTYSYKNRYFGEVNFGYNGSENFAPSKRYGFFPAYGVGWIVSEEPFFKAVKNALPFFKIRFSDGEVGAGTGGPRFGYLTFVNTSANGYSFGMGRNGVNGIDVANYGSNITWATSHKMDLGFELKALNGDISLVVDLFKEHRTGVFLQRGTVAEYVGLSSVPWGNLGVIDNKGIDMTLESRPMKLGKTTWQFRGNLTYNKDNVIENDQPVNPLYPWQNTRGTNYNAEWGLIATGLYTAADIANPLVAKGSWAVRPGDIKYKDINGDGVIDAHDNVRIGRGDVPAVVYGFGVNTTYQNFYISVFFEGTGDEDRIISGDGIIPFNNSSGAERSNLFSIATDRWTVDNPRQNAFYPRLGYGSAVNANNSQTSTWWMKNVAFIRLKTAEIGYTLPQSSLSHLGVKSSKLFLQGVNLLTFSKFKLWDPELNTTNGTNYPLITTFSIGLQVSL
jgi:TonB-linked SusC/RagA family outer membrane protein